MKYTDQLFSQREWKSFTPKFSPSDLCKRGGVDFAAISPIIDTIEKNVISRGDAYIAELTQQFDGVLISDFLLSEAEYLEAENKISEPLQKAIDQAYENIVSFHMRQMPTALEKKETSPGVWCWQEFRAIETVGLYVPGGTAPLFSTVLMLAIPALLAGCRQKIICTPPQADGTVHPAIVYTAKKCGITQIYKVGGAQAIFAMAHGTNQIPKVDKIFGPGNSFVTAAKMKVSTHTAIDMPAGPSEVLVIADSNAHPVFCAADLLSQAEHGDDSQSVLVCCNEQKAEEIIQETLRQLDTLPRKEIAKKALENSFCVLCDSPEQMIKFSNLYAPEHLILHLDDWESVLSTIEHAGSVFCGAYSCESAGDYASGTNHTLPTSAFAKSYSGITLQSFGKWITFQYLTKQGLDALGDTIAEMAEQEGLHAHKNAVVLRRG